MMVNKNKKQLSKSIVAIKKWIDRIRESSILLINGDPKHNIALTPQQMTKPEPSECKILEI